MTVQPDRHLSIVSVAVALYSPLTAGTPQCVLMLRRAPGTVHGGLWALPAGHVDEGESARQAAVREVREEVGLTVEPNDLTFTDLCSSADPDGRHRLSLLFRTERWSGVPVRREPTKHTDLRWWELGELPDETSPLMRAWLANRCLVMPSYTEEGWR